MNLTYIDIHSHLNLSPLVENQETILAKMREVGVGTITVGTGLETSKMAVKIAEENPDICWATVGIHPCHTCGEESEPYDANTLEELARHPKVVAIGETGLDYFHKDTPESRKIQEEIFRQHINLALKVQKPLMLHVRASRGSDDAYYDALTILKDCSLENFAGSVDVSVHSELMIKKSVKVGEKKFLKANFHFFGGSKDCMEAIVAAGFTVSVDGPITFSSDYDEMIKAVPFHKIMIETDAPFAAPKPYRGKPCEPWMVVEVAKKIAELKNLSLETIQKQLLENTKSFFNLDILLK